MEFKNYHPIVNFAYFLAVLGFSMVFMHPIALFISLVSGFCYSLMLGGKKSVRTNLLYLLPLMLSIAVINPLLNHQGSTILAYLPSGNPLTAEAVVYGIAAGVMLWSVLCHFSCFNKIMTSDKIMYLSGRLFPSLSLMFSMILQFVPKFKAQFRTVSAAQQGIGKSISDGSVKSRIKNGISLLFVMLTWSLEQAIETADSMKSRGYGLKNRSAYSPFLLSRRDIGALLYILALSGYIIFSNALKFSYFPTISRVVPLSVSVYTAYLLLFAYPIIIELCEVIKWKKLR